MISAFNTNRYWIIPIYILINVLLWIFCPMILALIHLTIFIAVWFVCDVDKNAAANYEKRRKLNSTENEMIKHSTEEPKPSDLLKEANKLDGFPFLDLRND